ncbi:MAG: galactose-1-phosphate uridylyltransferase [Candidatus Nezhaarchaeales archaeon]
MENILEEPEIRRDIITDRWVIVAPQRMKRPKERKGTSIQCPFCPGNEHMTPPAWLVYSRVGGELVKLADEGDERVKNWIVRCFPNMFPALKNDLPFEERLDVNFFPTTTLYSGFGYHEVIVESPDHNAHPHSNSIRNLELVVEAYFDVMTRLSYEKRVKYVCLFRNYKLEAGASISHPHSQVIALPVVPSMIRREVKAARRYNRDRGGCMYCDLIESEVGSPRLIYADEYYVVVAPWASILPYELWIIPRRHDPSFINTYPKERKALSRVLKTTLLALKKALNDPPYNLGFHVAPLYWKGESYHWHIEVYPRIVTLGGFELATNMYINTTPPEKVADDLRKIIENLDL